MFYFHIYIRSVYPFFLYTDAKLSSAALSEKVGLHIKKIILSMCSLLLIAKLSRALLEIVVNTF